jgi:hypothetical protein
MIVNNLHNKLIVLVNRLKFQMNLLDKNHWNSNKTNTNNNNNNNYY